ncbi:MAG: histidine--tRNA ligase [Gammaproteobacteria bacterium]
MSQRIRSVRGFNDIPPSESAIWQQVEAVCARVLASYGYGEMRLPIVESTDLFKRSIGEVTDIVEKEMYTFPDRNGDSLTLRPEGTASCVRAALDTGLVQEGVQRLWYAGPMFRHERPQRGRYRQFHQIGAEAYGLSGPDVDAEIILMSARLWKELGLKDVRLELNSLGTPESRGAYRQVLVEYLRQHESELDEDAKRRLDSNPLRILDSKNPQVQAVVENAPKLADHLDDESQAHLDAVCAILDESGVSYSINPKLVRGLDYYSRTVFEWITDTLGAQGTICAGGRYDGLIEQLGGKPTPAIGFAMGIERLVELIKEEGLARESSAADVYLVAVGERAGQAAFALAEKIRDAAPGLRLITHCGGGSFKSQFKKADKSGAGLALILGDSELDSGTIGYKPLRGQGDQETLTIQELLERLAALMPGGH